MLNKSKVIISALLLSILAFGVFGQNASLPKGVSQVTSLEGITEYRLENGLQIVLFPDPTKQNFVVNIVYRVGSRHEGYGETGMAHLLEHLNFKGTPTHPKIMDEITERGALANASTWYDRTNYFEILPSSESNLEWALGLEADRMINSYIAKKDLDTEFSVVRNEMEAGENNASGILSEKVMATAYQWHNYGKTTIGARSDVELVKIENLQAFYRRYYQPDNATLIVSGNFNEAKALELIQQKFGSIPRPTRKLEPTWTIEPVQDGERHVTIRRTGDTQIVTAGYHIPPASHPEFAATLILAKLLGESPSGKLYKTLVETKKAASVNAYAFKNKEPSYILFSAEVAKDGSADESLKTLIETIETFAQTTPSKEDVERQVAASLTNIESALNDTTMVGVALTESVAAGDWRQYFLIRESLKKVTPEAVQNVAKKYLLQSNRTSGVFIPTANPVRAEVPRLTDEEILALGNAYKSDVKIALGEVFDPTPNNIQSRLKTTQIGGLKVSMLPKKNRGEAVYISFKMNLGDLQNLMNRGKIGEMTAGMLMNGTVNKTRQQLKDELSRLKAQGGTGGDATKATASFRTNKTNLPAVLKLLAEIFKQPAFSETELELLKQEKLTALEAERSEPESIAYRELNRIIENHAKGDPRYTPTLDEEIAEVKAITAKDLKAYHSDFYGTSAATIAIVGDYDEKEVTNTLTQSFGGWKSAKAYQRIANNNLNNPAANKSFLTPDKANAVFYAYTQMKLRDDNPDYPAMIVANYIIGDGMLNSRLAKRIRQKEGISYTVMSAFASNSLDERGEFSAYAIFAPENLERLENAFKEEINKVVTEGFTAEEVAAAKKSWLESKKTMMAMDAVLVNSLVDNADMNRSVMWQDQLEKKVESLTTEQVNAIVKKYLDLNKMTFVKAGDFNKGKAAKQ